MAFVYMYTSIQGNPQYIGKVSGDDFCCLEQRIKQHVSDFEGKQRNWTVWYVELPSAADADSLETILISREAPPYNKAKRQWGRSQYFANIAPDWKLYIPSPTGKNKNQIRNKIGSHDWRDVAWSFRCSVCGKDYSERPNCFHFDTLPSNSGAIWCAEALVCHKCQQFVSAAFETLWDDLLGANGRGITLRRRKEADE